MKKLIILIFALLLIPIAFACGDEGHDSMTGSAVANTCDIGSAGDYGMMSGFGMMGGYGLWGFLWLIIFLYFAIGLGYLIYKLNKIENKLGRKK